MGMIFRIGWLAAVLLAWMTAAHASDTMLMFVGEDLEVLTIASRREEAAWSAPAIAHVITKNDIDAKGAVTISQALDDQPGFHMNRTEKGTIPYLRGIQNSALFLFDTVPMGSGASKSDNMIDYETSLAPVKRIEVVRGTGSVLWGPDAFAGVVNAVPYTGRDFQGVKTGVVLSSEDAPGEAYMNWGRAAGDWASFVSVSGRRSGDDDPFNVVRFWNDGRTPEPSATRYGSDTPEDSRYITLYGNLSYRNWLTLSAKLADSKNAYTVSDWYGRYTWEEQAESTTGQFKLEASRKFTPDSGVRFTGYYKKADQHQSFVDETFDTKESSWYGEAIFEQSLFSSTGLFTLGTSVRQDEFSDIPVWDSFLPDFFREDNVYFLPSVRQSSFDNRLTSVFTQYRHELDSLEVWAGTRYDAHEMYEDKTSYNLGFAWNLGDFILKSMFGTAYRNPFARQLEEIGGNSLERIRSFNTQLSWKVRDSRAALTLFNNDISSHVIEDRYSGAGLSTANSQTINGAELAFSHNILDTLFLSCNLTLLDNTGPLETYLYNDYTYADEDGNTVRHYEDLEYAYDTGPKRMGSLKLTWQASDKVTLMPELTYFSRKTLYYPAEDEIRVCSEALILDMNIHVKQVFPFDLSIFANNLLDEEYESLGQYSVTRRGGFSVGMGIHYTW